MSTDQGAAADGGTTEPVPDEPPPPDSLDLAAGFPPAEHGQWRALVGAVLAKSGGTLETFEAPAVHPEATDVRIQPLYLAEGAAELVAGAGVPGRPPYVRGADVGSLEATGWDVRVRHDDPDAESTAAAILTDLACGASSLWLVLGEGGIAVDALSTVLDGVYLDLAPIVLDAGPHAREAADAFLTLAADRGIAPSALTGSLGADPFGRAIRAGVEPDLGPAVELAARSVAEHPGLTAITVDGTAIHEAGGSIVEELGTAMAAGVAHLRALTEAGLSIDDAAGQLEFRSSVGADQFLAIAGLRAARRLWGRVGEVAGVSGPARAMRQHAVTSSVMMARRDPWVNMLRTTLAAVGAGVGGAAAVTVLPFDHALGRPDAFARRIARNTHALLIEEGHLARVIDPAGGSWYVESLTDQVAQAAWSWFTEIERSGGLAAALASGMVAERTAAVWGRRRDGLAHRRPPMTGVSEFPNLGEVLPQRVPRDSSATGAVEDSPVRAAADFEALRDAADVVAEKGSRPAVFLATLGSIADSTARASFASNLFQAGGLETPSNGADDGDDDSIVAKFTEAAARVACICGRDDAYPERATALAAALKLAGADFVWIAGPAQAVGDNGSVDDRIHAGMDAVGALRRTHEVLGVPA